MVRRRSMGNREFLMGHIIESVVRNRLPLPSTLILLLSRLSLPSRGAVRKRPRGIASCVAVKPDRQDFLFPQILLYRSDITRTTVRCWAAWRSSSDSRIRRGKALSLHQLLSQQPTKKHVVARQEPSALALSSVFQYDRPSRRPRPPIVR